MSKIKQAALAAWLALAGSLAVAGPVNVNSADAETLSAELTGIGLARAQAIVEYREQFGPFKTVDELLNVSGVGERTLEMNRGDIRLSDDAKAGGR